MYVCMYHCTLRINLTNYLSIAGWNGVEGGMYVCVCVCVCVCVYVVCMYLADDLRCVLRAAAMKGDGEMVCRRALPGVCLFACFFFFFVLCFLFSVFNLFRQIIAELCI